MIKSDTLLFGSFSSNPGNLGCLRFNSAFQRAGINAIYKSFKCNLEQLKSVFDFARIGGISGFALSMPLKRQGFKFCDYFSNKSTEKTQIINTVVYYSDTNQFVGANLDIEGIDKYLTEINCPYDDAIIIGTGAFAITAKYVLNVYHDKSVFMIDSRSKGLENTIKQIKNKIIFNATPLVFSESVIDKSNIYIDSNPKSLSGKRMSFLTAKSQFDFYGYSFYNKYFEDI